MLDEPAEPRRGRGALLVELAREDLDGYSVADLRERVDALREEIARAEKKIGAKANDRAAADALFGTSS